MAPAFAFLSVIPLGNLLLQPHSLMHQQAARCLYPQPVSA